MMRSRLSRQIRFAALGAVTFLVATSLARAEDRRRWIVVAAPAFEDLVTPLCERRSEQGFEVIRVDLRRVAGATPDAVLLRAHLRALCQARPGESQVLLVGAVSRPADQGGPSTVVPPLKGKVGRMKGRPTDNGYGCLDGGFLPDVAVGRLPARRADEARAMVRKTLEFEEQLAPAAWRSRISLIVGHPGGSTAIERRLAASIVKTAVGSRFDKVHPQWTTRAIVHMPESPFSVPDDRLGELSLLRLREGQMFSVYLGHSGAAGLSSAGRRFLTREEWAGTSFGPGAGILLTCGCHACQLTEGWTGEGHALAAMRNPAGPVAVIGAHGESYGAMGKLAFEGLFPLLAEREPPARLGRWWLAAAGGLGRGRIGRITFWLYDRADGSNGKVDIEVQRREHLEMWMLLGDPALRLPLQPVNVELVVEGRGSPGATLLVRGRLPPTLGRAPVAVELLLERPFGGEIPGAATLPPPADPARDRAMLARHEKANDVRIDCVEVEAKDGRFEGRLSLPAGWPWKRAVVRARATHGGVGAHGVLSLPVAP